MNLINQHKGRCNVKRNRITKSILTIALFALTVAVALSTSGAAWAKEKNLMVSSKGHPAASTIIEVTECGTLNANNSIYLVTQNLTQTGNGDCLYITGDYDTLDLQSFSVQGPGNTISTPSTGAGIHLKSGANENVIEGAN